jgi:hypothetical protein
MEKELERAEALATRDKVKKRLELVRMEFDYMKHMVMVNNLYNAGRMQGSTMSLERLNDGLGTWNRLLDSFYDENGRMRTIPGWPGILPFKGTRRPALGLVTARWWERKEKKDNPFAWDTGSIPSRQPAR